MSFNERLNSVTALLYSFGPLTNIVLSNVFLVVVGNMKNVLSFTARSFVGFGNWLLWLDFKYVANHGWCNVVIN